MLYFSSFVSEDSRGAEEGLEALYEALKAHGVPYTLLSGARDVWMRDYMPVVPRSGRPVCFRYDPCYLEKYPELKTDVRRDLARDLPCKPRYVDIRLDGGNAVFSPSKKRVIVSERAFAENPDVEPAELTARLEELLEAEVIWIEALQSDMTGHADGMVRFVDEDTVIGNRTPYKKGLEQRNRRRLEKAGLKVIDFPYFAGRGESAEGCYLNFLQTGRFLFLPTFEHQLDGEAIATAQELFPQEVVPVPATALARHGGVFNCVSWEY